MVVVLFNGELNSFHLRMYLKSEIPDAARVFIGPAEIAFTRIFFLPKSLAKYFVGNTQTGGYGLTLTAASNVIYYSNSYDLEKRLQSEDRAHRIGQHKPVTYVDLIAEKTVDEKIIKALRKKINIASEVMGDKVQDWI